MPEEKQYCPCCDKEVAIVTRGAITESGEHYEVVCGECDELLCED